MSKNTIANGQGQCALRDSLVQEFNRDLVAQAFLRDGCGIDLSPNWNDSFRIWTVSATNENGNAEAIVGFFIYAEALQFINGLEENAGIIEAIKENTKNEK